MESQEPSDLLQAYLDGTLSSEEEIALEERLKTDALLADWLVLLATEEAILKEWASTASLVRSDAVHEPWVEEPLVPAEFESASGAAAPTPIKQRKLRRRLLWAGGILLVVIAAAALGAWQFGLFEGGIGPSMEPVAHLDDVYGTVQVLRWSDPEEGFPAQSGQPVSRYEKVRTGAGFGFATIRYDDGTRLELSTDTTLQVGQDGEPEKRMWLSEGGFVMVEVPREMDGRPLVLLTPNARITVRAARFSCACTAQTTTVQMEEGQAELVHTVSDEPVKGETPLTVGHGYYGVFQEGKGMSSSPVKTLQVRTPRKVLSDPAGPVMSLAYAPDRKSLASGGWDGAVRKWSTRSSAELACLREEKQTPPVRSLAYFPNSESIAVGGDREVHIWNLSTEQEDPGLPQQLSPVESLAITRSGKWLATASLGRGESSLIQIWSWPLGANHIEIRERSGPSQPLAFGPDSQVLAAGLKDGMIKVWEISTQKKLAGIATHSGAVLAIQFNPAGDLLASAGQDRTAKLWRWKKEDVSEPEHVLTGHNREIRPLAISSDGRLLATGAMDGTARLWEVSTGKELAVLRHGCYGVTAVAFAPDGKTVATAGWNEPVTDLANRPGAVKLWDIPENAAPPK